MRSSDLFIYLLLLFGWVIFQVIRRVLKRPKPLGTIDDEAPRTLPAEAAASTRTSPWDVGWGRTPDATPVPVGIPGSLPDSAPPSPIRRGPKPSAWVRDEPQDPLANARQANPSHLAARKRVAAARPARHPHRPSLHTQKEMRDAVVMAAVIGPCRAMEAWQAPHERS